MLSSVALVNIGLYAGIAVLAWVGSPYPADARVPRVLGFFEVLAVGRRVVALLSGVTVVALLVPAVLGVAPLRKLDPDTVVGLAGIAYPGLAIGSALGVALLVGASRLRRVLRPSVGVDLTSPPRPGPTLVRATARRPAHDDGASKTVDGDGLLHDYRQGTVSTDPARHGGPLSHAGPFVLEGPAGSIEVDPAGAYLGLKGRDVADRRIDDGDEVTVLGTVRTDGDGGRRMSGEDDLLYVTNQTPDELRGRVRRVLYAGSVYTMACLGLAGAALDALAG